VYTYNREPFKHFKRATEKTVISRVRVGVIVNPKLCRKKIKIPYTVKVIAGVVVTGDKLFTDINDTGDH